MRLHFIQAATAVEFDGSLAPINTLWRCRAALAHSQNGLIVECEGDAAVFLKSERLDQRAIFSADNDAERRGLNFDQQPRDLRLHGFADFAQSQGRARIVALWKNRGCRELGLEDFGLQGDADTA